MAKSKEAATVAEEQSFEQGLVRLETLVGELEKGELSLNDAVTCYEEATALQQSCLAQLESAEKRLLTLEGDEPPTPDDHELEE